MMRKAWNSIEEVSYCFSRSSIKFQGHMALKSSNLTLIGHFQTVTPLWIHQWLRNDAESLKWHRIWAILFFGVIHRISRSHGLKNWRFESNLSKITRPVAAIKSLRFALFGIFYYFRLNFFVTEMTNSYLNHGILIFRSILLSGSNSGRNTDWIWILRVKLIIVYGWYKIFMDLFP